MPDKTKSYGVELSPLHHNFNNNSNSTGLLSSKKQLAFTNKFLPFFQTEEKLYHFTLTSETKELSVFRNNYNSFLKLLSKRKITWKRVKVLEVQIKGNWHLHIAGTYLPRDLTKLWTTGFVRVSLWNNDKFTNLCTYLKKDFANTMNFLTKNSKIYRFDDSRQGKFIVLSDEVMNKKEYLKEYFKANKEKHEQVCKNYYQLNKDVLKAKRRARYLAKKSS